jgi:hypothetical protein
MPTPRANVAGATGADGRVYVIGGLDLAASLSDAVEVYSPTNDQWTAAAPLPEAREFFSSAIALSDGRILVIGGLRGQDRNSALDIVVYNIATDSWSHEP